MEESLPIFLFTSHALWNVITRKTLALISQGELDSTGVFKFYFHFLLFTSHALWNNVITRKTLALISHGELDRTGVLLCFKDYKFFFVLKLAQYLRSA